MSIVYKSFAFISFLVCNDNHVSKFQVCLSISLDGLFKFAVILIHILVKANIKFINLFIKSGFRI